jgi:hypothetical protein
MAFDGAKTIREARAERRMPKRDPEYGETRFVRLQRSFANHTVGVVILAAFAVIGAIGTVIDGGATIAGLFGDDDKRPPPTAPAAVRFGEAELAEEMNERFAFSFRHPTTWEQQGGVNSDGAVFRAPQPATQLLAYGVHAADGPTDLLERVGFLGARAKTNVLDQGGVVVSDDLRIGPWAGPGEELPAQRLVYRARDADTGRAVTAVQLLTSQGGRDVTIICQVPTREYKAYAGACNQLVATLQIERL